jgi:hypothetical protein
MRRLFTALAALAFAASLTGVAPAMPKSTMGGAMTNSQTMKKCPKSQHWVKGYTKKDGTKVKGYCR